MSFNEKSAWGLLAGIVLVGWFYFPAAFAAASGAGGGSLIGISIAGVIALVVIEVVYHAVVAATGGDERDERDALIDLKAEQIGGIALGIALFSLVGYIVAQSVLGAHPVPTALEVAVLILLALTLSEIAKLTTQIAYYRLGA